MATLSSSREKFPLSSIYSSVIHSFARSFIYYWLCHSFIYSYCRPISSFAYICNCDRKFSLSVLTIESFTSELSTTPLSEEPGLVEYLREICDPPCPAYVAEDFVPLLHSALTRPNGSNQWAVYVVASLYWRATGSGFQANVCAIKAAQLVPKQFRDVVLVSLGANLMRQVL